MEREGGGRDREQGTKKGEGVGERREKGEGKDIVRRGRPRVRITCT